jgi:hypothetical protein
MTDVERRAWDAQYPELAEAARWFSKNEVLNLLLLPRHREQFQHEPFCPGFTEPASGGRLRCQCMEVTSGP